MEKKESQGVYHPRVMRMMEDGLKAEVELGTMGMKEESQEMRRGTLEM